MSGDQYYNACMRAAENQGLTPACEALEQIFGDDAGLVQTGGFCMVIQVECPVGYVWVTYEGDDEYMIGYYTDESENVTDDYRYVNFGNIAETVAWYRSERS